MALSETRICNLALARLGAKRINALTDATNEAVQCNLHYEPVRDALLRRHAWRFARTRAVLSEDAAAPVHGWENQFSLPADFLRLVRTPETGEYPFTIEGQKYLTDDDEAEIVYVRRVTDPTEFDPLFVQVLVLELVQALSMPLSQDKNLRESIRRELVDLNHEARLVNLDEAASDGPDPKPTWTEARSNQTTG